LEGVIEIMLCLGPKVKHIYNALIVEAAQPQPHKGVVNVRATSDGECLVMEIKSSSLSGLRALTNSFLYLVHASYSALSSSID